MSDWEGSVNRGIWLFLIGVFCWIGWLVLSMPR